MTSEMFETNNNFAYKNLKSHTMTISQALESYVNWLIIAYELPGLPLNKL